MIDHALLTIFAIETGIRGVIAGPKAIALTPVKADEKALTAADFVVSDEHWLSCPDKPFAEAVRAIAIL